MRLALIQPLCAEAEAPRLPCGVLIPMAGRKFSPGGWDLWWDGVCFDFPFLLLPLLRSHHPIRGLSSGIGLKILLPADILSEPQRFHSEPLGVSMSLKEIHLQTGGRHFGPWLVLLRACREQKSVQHHGHLPPATFKDHSCQSSDLLKLGFGSCPQALNSWDVEGGSRKGPLYAAAT